MGDQREICKPRLFQILPKYQSNFLWQNFIYLHFLQQMINQLTGLLSFMIVDGWNFVIHTPKNLSGKDRQRQLLYYVNLIRACKKVLNQLVYIGKKFVCIPLEPRFQPLIQLISKGKFEIPFKDDAQIFKFCLLVQ